MDPAPDPLTASAPFPTIPATGPRPRAARPRRHAAPFRSDHPAAAAFGRRSGSDLSRRPAASSSSFSSLQEGTAPLVGSWGASRDAGFVFGSGAAGAPGMTRSFSSGCYDTPLFRLSAAVEELALDGSGSGRPSDADASGGDDPVSEMDAGDSLGASGSNPSLHGGFCPDFFDDQAEQLDEGTGAPSQCEGTDASSLATPEVDSPPCADENVSVDFVRCQDSLPVLNSVIEGSLAKDGSSSSANGGHGQHKFFVFGEHAQKWESTADATQANIDKVPSADEAGAAYCSEQLNVSGAEELAEFGSFDEKPFTVEDHNVATRNKGAIKGMGMNRRTVKPKKFSAARQVFSSEPASRSDCYSAEVALEKELNFKEAGSFTLENSGINCAKEQADYNNSAMHSKGVTLDRTEFSSVVNLEHSGHSDFIFTAPAFDQSTVQRHHNKKKGGGMDNHANFIQSLPTSSIGVVQSEVSASQQCRDSAAQWTTYNEVEQKAVTVSSGTTHTKTENFRHHEDCEKWRIRGNQAYTEGQLTKAEECYTHGIASVSSNEASRKALMLCYSNRAATRMSLGKMREALSDCREATAIDSSFLKAQVRAANCLLALGDVEEARKGFEICLKSNHASSLDRKIVEEASDGLQKAEKVSGFMLQSREYLVTKAFDKIPSALQMISDALSISSYSDNLMEMKAEALLLLRQYEEVIRFCEETLYQAEKNSVYLCPHEHSQSNNLEKSCSSVRLWRYHFIAKSYFFLGKLEEAHQFIKKYEQATLLECRCGKQSQQLISPFSTAISELLRLKAAGNEAFQAGKYSEAVEYYTAALLSNTESLSFSAICLCNRAAAYQAMGQILDAIADCSLAIALDAEYSKALSRRSSLYELIKDYGQAANDLRRLISLLEKQLQENMSVPSEKTESIRNNLNRANLRLSSLERDARKGTSLNMYLILGIEPSCSDVDIKKAYRKAALRHHPDKAGKYLVRSENISDALWREITNEIRKDADYLFKLIGKAYAMLSDPTMKKQMKGPGNCSNSTSSAQVTGAARSMKMMV
ncbi:hypothetical protein ACP4OV_020588 [Aristida adscensionis]